MAETDTSSGSSGALFTLTEVSKRTGISMPTLQRYKKLYQDRIPSKGSGRTQRYPEESLAVFEELKKENLSRRGRPRKNAARPTTRRVSAPAPVTDEAAADTKNLLTLKDVEQRTGISYPTLLRYVKTSVKRIPHVGTGRKRRYPPEAVDVFKTLREESRRSRRASSSSSSQESAPAEPRAPRQSRGGDATLLRHLKDLQASVKDLQKQVKQLEKEIQRPLKVTLQRQG